MLVSEIGKITDMMRKTLWVDVKDVQDGLRLSKAASTSDLLRRALREYVRRLRAHQILEYLGSGIWEGDLSRMRGDRPSGRRPPRRAARSRGHGKPRT